MKSKSSLRNHLILVGSIAALLATPAVHAATVTWDTAPGTVGAGNGTVTGGLGTWNTTNGNWTIDGGANNIAWVNANLDTAVFGGTAGAVTLGASIDVGGLTFNTTGYGITTTGFALNFAAANNTILFNNIAAASITGPVGGAGNVILSASNPATAGALTLNGTSTDGWSGTTTINANMTLALAGSNQGLSDTTGITLNGGNITLTNANNTEGALDRVAAVGITSNGGTITYSNTNTGTAYAETLGTVALTTGQLNVVSTNQVTSGTQTLTLGAGSLTHAAANTSAITFSGASLGANVRNSILVTGQADSAVGEIIGPWATWGTTAALQSDYATYNRTAGGAVNAFGIQNANIAATADTTWTDSTKAYTNNTSSLALGVAAHNMLALRNTAATATITISTASGNLNTYGLLNGVSTLLTVAATGTGALSTPSGGGNLFVTTGSGPITISAPINNNSGDVTLVKSGSGTLTLSSTTSNYIGGTVINSGALQITADSNLGNLAGDLTVNGSATLQGAAYTLNSGRTVTLNNGAILSFLGTAGAGDYVNVIQGQVTGSGGINMTGGSWNNLTLSATTNNFTGPIRIGANSGGNQARLSVASLGDSASPITFGGMTGTNDSPRVGNNFIYTGTTLTLSNRWFEVTGAATNAPANIFADGSGPLTIATDLRLTTAGSKLFTLQGGNGGNNTFGGRITDGTEVVAQLALTKAGTGTWILSGNNTYSGGTTLSAGTLKAGAANALGTGNVTVTAGTLVIDVANAMADTAGLFLPSAGAANLTMTASDTVGSLFLAGAQQPNGAYSDGTNAGPWMNAGSGILTVGTAAAQPVYWDLDGATAGAGGATPTGTWDAANTFWNDVAGTGTAAAWTAGATAAFAAGANATGTYTVTVDGTHDIGGLTFEEGNVTLSGGTALRLVSNSLAHVATGLTATIVTPLSQDASPRALTKIGPGTLILSGNNTFTGAVTLSAGALTMSGNNTFSSATVSAGTLILSGDNAMTGAVNLNAGTLQLAHANAIDTATGVAAVSGTTLNLRNDSATVFSTPLTTLNTTGGSSMTINVDRVSSGTGNQLTLNGGLFSNQSHGNETTLNISGGNSYSLNLPTLAITRSGGGGGGGGTNLNATTNATIGPVTTSATQGIFLRLTGTSTGNSMGAISQSGSAVSLQKQGTGTWTLTGASNFTGAVAITVGSLRITNGSALGTTAGGVTQSGASELAIDGSGGAVIVGAEALQINGGGISDAGALRNIAGNNTYGGTVTLAGQSRINSDSGTLTLNNATAVTAVAQNLVVGGAGNVTISGAITTTSGFVLKDGNGTLTLSGANTYTGSTTISAGTVNANSTSALGSGAASNTLIFTGGTLQASGTIASPSTRAVTLTSTGLINTNGNAVSIAGAMSGGGGVTKSGAGILTLTGANNYTGITTVSTGQLTVSGTGTLTGTTGLTVSNGTAFNYLPTTIGTTLTLGAGSTLDLADGSAIGLAWDATTANQITALGAATVGTGAGVGLNMGGSFNSGTTYTILTAASGLDTGTYAILNPVNYTAVVGKTPTAVTVTPTTATSLTDAFWTGGFAGFTNVWAVSDGSANSNWVTTAGGGATGLVPGAGANVAISATSVTTAPTATVLGANMSIGSLTIADTTNGLGLVADGNTLTIASTAGITMNASVPASTIAASVALGTSQTWTNNSINTLTVSGAISGANNLTKAGTGTLVLSGANTYVNTTISAGTLQIGAGGGTGSLGSGTVLNNAALVFNRSGQISVSNVISGSGTVTQANAGNLEILGNNTYGGGTFINSGILILRTEVAAGTGRLGSGAVTVANGASYLIWAPNAVTLTNNIVLNGPTGVAGRPALNQDGGAGKVTLSGTVTLNATSDIGIGGGSSNDMDITGVISGVGGMIVDERGQSAVNRILTLTGVNTYTGPTTLNGGTLKAGVVSVANVSGAFGNNSAVTLANNPQGVTLDITGFNTQIGSLTGGGTSGGNVTLGAAALTVGGDNTSPAAYAGVISGTGGVTKIGSGTQILSGVGTYTGLTTVNSGTLTLSGARTAAATGGISVAALDGSTAILNVSNGTFTAGTFFVGTSGGAAANGTVNQTGGSLTMSGNQLLVGNGNATGTYNLSAGTLTTVAGSLGVVLGVNTGTTGTFNLSGTGTLTMPATSTLQISRSDNNAATGTTGLFSQTAGTATVGILQMGGGGATTNANANSTLTLTGGTFTATTFNQLSGGNNSVSTINIGGTAVVTLPNLPTARGTGATATINFDGGTLRNSATGTFITGLTNAFIEDGGARFDTSLNSTTISQNLLTHGSSLGGGLTKIGTNTLTLSGANTYTGLTDVQAGTLALSGGAAIVNSGAVNVASVAGATLLVSASETIGSLSGGTGANGTVALGANTLTVGDASTTTFGGTITGTAPTGTLVKEGAGVLNLAPGAVLTFDTLTANDGTLNVNSALGTGTGTGVVAVNNSGTKLRFGSVSQTLSSLTIGAGSTVVFTSGAASGSFSGGGGKAPSLGGSAVVPEPGTLGLLLVGALGVLGRRRRQA